MGIFGFIGNVASAAVKVAVTPVAIVADLADVVVGDGIGESNTSKLLDSALEDLEDSVDELG